MPYPSTLTTFPYPTPSNKLSNPSHSALENLQSSTIGQLQAFLGTDASVQGTLIYDIRSPNSNGGGHIQTANKGGTGQTTYNKGDILVAQSNSVLTKLAVGSVQGYALVVDSSQPVGVKWGPTVSNKVFTGQSIVSLKVGQTSTLSTIFTTTIPGSTLGTTNAIRYTGVIQTLAINNTGVATFEVDYGSSSIATFTLSPALGSVLGNGGTIEGMIMNNSSVAAQIGYVRLLTSRNTAGSGTALDHVYGFAYGTSTIDSSANQTLSIKYQGDGLSQSSILTGPFIVEKIA